MFAVYRGVLKNLHEGCWRVVCYSAGRQGRVALAAVAANMEVQNIRCHPRACVGVLLGPGRVNEPQAGVQAAGGVEQVAEGLAPFGPVHGSLLSATVVEVLFGALVETLSHCHQPRVIVVIEGLLWSVPPVLGCCIRQREAASLLVPDQTALNFFFESSRVENSRTTTWGA